MITILIIAALYFFLEMFLSEKLKKRKLLEAGIGFLTIGWVIYILNFFWYVPIVGLRYAVEPIVGDDFSTDLGVVFFMVFGLFLIVIDLIYHFFTNDRK